MAGDTRKNCDNCGDLHSGAGALCEDCTPITRRETRPLPPASLQGRRPLPPPGSARSRCPQCAAEATWENVERYVRREGGNVEVLYYCAVCRSCFEFAAWVEVPARRSTSSERRHRPYS